ncbi:TetR/AcrR family transcriptional regulator [Bacillus sp. MUM 13]|uniref:TetR/AcrR family transcriptional regulator n=1 Tax=Bacillus sp. MUM 13 TaxID=1678001 RepID=UPI0008F5A75D|nr:TetR/AcrR family transcriptional regulator [Bacillus sp. MUM 13]OIK08836.1 TetR family transcriptional regulator [Bacillus sp. MUM 13]
MSPRAGLDESSVILAAVELAEKKGTENVTMATLARKLGVKTPSLYNHIASLKSLQNKMAIHALRHLYADVSEAASGKSGDESVASIARAYVNFARQKPGLYQSTLQAPDVNDLEYQKAGSSLVDLILEKMSYLELDEDQALHMVRGLRSILHGFASLEQLGGFGLPLKVNTTLDVIIQTYLTGIKTQKAHNKKNEGDLPGRI